MAEDDSDLFLKRAEGVAAVAALRVEAELLRFAAHPGVVEVVRSGEVEAGVWELAQRRVAGTDLSGLGPWSPDELAGYGAAVATTLADLHDIGVVHGRLAAEHLLVDEAGRPVICGFGQARRCLGDPAADAWKAADVADLARCLSTRQTARAPKALARAFDRATTASRRPLGARQLARLLERATPAATLPSPVRADQPPSADTDAVPEEAARLRRLPVRLRVAAGVAGLAAVAVATVLAVAPSGRDPVPPPRARASSVVACPPVDDGCVPLRSAGGVVTLARGRFRIGRPGDVVVLGRWTCAPAPLAALLRPADGRVWVFTRWARVGGRATATPLARVAGARSLRALPGADGCDRVEVLRRSGTPVVLAAQAGGEQRRGGNRR